MLRILLGRPFRAREAWARVAASPLPGWGGLAGRLAILCMVPAIAWVTGLLLGLPNPWVGAEAARASPALLLRGALLTALAAFATVTTLAAALAFIAPSFGGRRDLRAAATLALGASALPLLVGVTLVLPVLMLAVLVAGLQALGVISAGAGPLLAVPERGSTEFAVASAAVSVVLSLVAGAFVTGLGWL